MSELFGLLEIPVPPPESDDDPVADPLLKVLLSFMKDVLNAETGAAWAHVAPSDPKPVAFTFAHNPDPTSFNSKKTPALYMWRASDKGRARYSTGILASDGPITVLWVPPSTTQEKRRIRQTFPNAIKKSLQLAFEQGRHKAWKVTGDTYYDAQEYGSVLLRHARLSKIDIGEFRDFELVIDMDQGKAKAEFDCFMFTVTPLELVEHGMSNPNGIPYDAIDHVEGTIRLGGAPDALDAQGFDLQLSLDSVTPSSGPAAGNTPIALAGKQFAEGMELVIGGVLVDVVFVDEGKATAITPAHAVGLVDIELTSPSGDRKTIPFTFT